MRKKNLCLIIIAVLAMVVCGCGSSIPDMSEQEQAYVTEYATNLIVKYSSVTSRELLNDMQMEREISKEEEEKARYLRTKELESLYLQEESEKETVEKAEDNNHTDGQTFTSNLPQKSIAEFFAEESIAIEYSSYDLCESYPEESEEELFMAMDATDGQQLCVVSFNVTNISTTDQYLDMSNKQGRFSLRLNNQETVSAQSTLLMNDLATYEGTIPVGATEELVLVFEVSDDVSQIDSLDLIMRDQAGENVLSLQ